MPRYGLDASVEKAIPAFLANWKIAATHIEEMEEGYENQNILVIADDAKFVIRRYSFRDRDDIPFEIEVLLACSERGFPVAQPVPDRAQAYIHDLGDLPAALFEYLEGHHPEPGSEGDRRLVGSWIARFHEATAGIRPVSDKAYDDFTEIRKALQLRPTFEDLGYADFVADLEHFREHLLPTLESVWRDLPHGIVHSDFYPGNLLIRDDQLVALLDFDTAFYGALVRDIADAVLIWSDRHPGFEPDPQAETEIVNGYAGVRPLTPAEQAVLRPTVLLACLSDAIRTITLRIHLNRPFAVAKECHMYCRYLRLLAASPATG